MSFATPDLKIFSENNILRTLLVKLNYSSSIIRMIVSTWKLFLVFFLICYSLPKTINVLLPSGYLYAKMYAWFFIGLYCIHTLFYCSFLLNQIAQIKLVACFAKTSMFKHNTELITLAAGTLKKKKKPIVFAWRVVIGKPCARNIQASGRERLI